MQRAGLAEPRTSHRPQGCSEQRGGCGEAASALTVRTPVYRRGCFFNSR
jgi:hypothetical protein